MTYKEFEKIMMELYHFTFVEGMKDTPEDEQFWLGEGYSRALRNIRAESEMKYVMPTLPEKKQEAYFKGYCQGIQKALQELKELR